MRRIVLSIAIVALAAVALGCEKNNEIIALEQIQESLETCPLGCEVPPPGCDIKGNISAAGNKYYHMPGGRSYADIRIQVDKGERWFCTEAEAADNGWLIRAP